MERRACGHFDAIGCVSEAVEEGLFDDEVLARAAALGWRRGPSGPSNGGSQGA